MKQALSARYGGLLVDASECDYASFKHLHLLCPNCKKSVFLVGDKHVEPHVRKLKRDGGEKTIQVKGSEVGSYFAHHPDVSASAVEACELRVRSMSDVERQSIKAQSRRQLLKVLHSHFWKILCSGHAMINHEYYVEYVRDAWLRIPGKDIRLLKALYENLLDALYDSFKFFFKDSKKDDCLLLVDKWMDRVKDIEAEIGGVKDLGDLFKLESGQEIADYLKYWESAIERNLQASIVCEMSIFLCQPRQRGILTELLEAGIYEYAFHSGRERVVYVGNKSLEGFGHHIFIEQLEEICSMDKKRFQKFTKSVLRDVNKKLVFVDWAGQYEKYHNEDLARGKAIAS